MSEDASIEESQIRFKVRTSSTDGNHSITMSDAATILDLKTKLATSDYENIPVERQRLIYSGRVMKDEEKLSFYKIKDGNTIHLVKSAASNAAQTPSTAGASVGSQAAGVPTNMAAGTAINNPLTGLTGARYAGHNINLPGLGTFGADGGMGAPPSDDQIADLLSDPNTQSTMNEALNNPAIVDMIINSSPQLRSMGPHARELLQSPFFRQMMTNPDIIRQQSRMRNMMGGGRGASAFPAPGVVDTPPEGAAGNNNPPTAGAAGMPNADVMTMLSGAGATNPFAALLNPQAQGQTPAQTPPPPASADQATPSASTSAAGSGDAQANPFASPFGGAPPAGLASMMTPEALQSTLQMMQDPQFASMMGLGAPGEAGAGGTASNPLVLTPEMMQQAMQSGAAGAAGNPFSMLFSAAAPPDTRPPEERYAEQLRQLNDMGFFEFDRNVEALRRSGGSVQGAIEQLLNGS